MKASLLYTLHKCGSMLLYQILKALSEREGNRLVSINQPNDQVEIWADGGYYRRTFATGAIFGPIRRYESPPAGSHCVVHLRDPRDLLTSLYFSVAIAHSLNPKAPERLRMSPGVFDQGERDRWLALGIDAFVRAAAPMFLERYMEYLDIIGSGAVFVRYEDMVSDFPAWTRTVLVGLGHQDHAEYIVQRFAGAVLPPRENSAAHIRKVVPGDHREKLNKETIAYLNVAYKYPLSTLRYSVA